MSDDHSTQRPPRQSIRHVTRRGRGLVVLAAGAIPLIVSAAVPTAASSQPPARPSDCTSAIRPASVMPVLECDGFGRILEKATKIVPEERHVAWQQLEVTGFTHFGMNTFTDREWGSGMESEDIFDPERVDVDQWMDVFESMGSGLAMLTAKHHDGFVLYPTRYSPHSVVASPWWVRLEDCEDADEAVAARARAEESRNEGLGDAYWQVRDAGCENPRGDVLGSYIEAARAAGLRVGVYMSPSDGAELPHEWHAETYLPLIESKPPEQRNNAERSTLEDAPAPPAGVGRFGNGSEPAARTIPTLVPNDDRAARVASGELPSFEVTVNDYDAYYLNQLYELFTEYGPIDELWLDGANPWSGSGITQDYDFTTWFRLIEQLSPDTLVFAGPQGTRWVGNEAGIARTTEWSVVPAIGDPDTAHNEGLIPGGAQAEDIGSRRVLADPRVRYLQWYPAEADTSVRPGWFYHPDENPKSAGQLVDIYQRSVGRNAVLLLNVPPAPDGRVDDDDVAELGSFGDSIRDTYRTNLLERRPGEPKPPRVVEVLTDGDMSTAWSPPRRATTGTLEIALPGPRTFDQVRIGEDITRGQQVEQFVIERWDDAAGTWVPLTAASGRLTATTIGYSRIFVLDEAVTTDRIRVQVLQARSTPSIAFVGLFSTVDPE